MIAERVDPLVDVKTRRRLTKAPKYLLFDLGVRRACAEEGTQWPTTYLGTLFEQWVGLELIRTAKLSEKICKIYFWRDSDGPEVDWIIEKAGQYIPVEVKWTDHPTSSDIKHMEVFLKEYSNTDKGYVVCQVPRRIKLSNNVYAIPWQEVDELISL